MGAAGRSARRRLQHAGCAGCLPRLGSARCAKSPCARPRTVRLRDSISPAGQDRGVTARARASSCCKRLEQGGCNTSCLGRRRVAHYRSSGRQRTLAQAVTAATELVYGRRAVREALRGRREVLELLATERAAREDWERKPKIVPEKTLTELAWTGDHQGVVARVEPFKYADAHELAAGEPLLVALDQVTDPRNLGAVIRSAEGAGATGVVLPAHNSARVTPAVARSSAGAVEHLPVAVVTNLSRYLKEIKGPQLWVYAAEASGTPMSQ